MDNQIYMLLDRLQEEIKTAKRAMFGGGKIVDEYATSDLIRGIADALPEAVKEAQYVLRDKERLITEAREKAEAIVSRAETEAQKMVSEHVITKSAKAEAERLMDNAEKYCAMLDFETKKRIDALFVDSEDRIAGILQVIRGCREELMGSMLKKGADKSKKI